MRPISNKSPNPNRSQAECVRLKHLKLGLSTLVVIMSLFSPVANTIANASPFEGNTLPFEAPLGKNDPSSIETMGAPTRDSRFNRLEVNGPGWQFSTSSVGNLISVENTASNSTIIVNAVQNNSGNISTTMGLSSGGQASNDYSK